MSSAERRARELVERHTAAWNDGDWETMEALYHPDAVIVGPEDWPEAGERRGWTEIRAQYESVRSPWSSDSLELITVEAREDRVLAQNRWTLQGSDSDIELAIEMSFSSRWRDDRIVELTFYRDHADAVADFED